jgi:hypothetical protein
MPSNVITNQRYYSDEMKQKESDQLQRAKNNQSLAYQKMKVSY